MSGQHSNVYASFSRRAFARLIDLLFVLAVCCVLYVVNWLAGFPVKYTTLFDARAITSFESFMYYNFPGVALTVSEGLRESFWMQGMMCGLAGAYLCIKVFSETDLTEDLKKFDLPTLIIHGDDDQIVPIDDSARLSAKIVKGATLKVYPGAPHGMCSTHKDQINVDLLAFIKGEKSTAA